MNDLIDRQAVIDALHFWFRDGFDEDKWWNSTHVLAAIEGLPSAQQGYKWETCFDCPLSHGCPKIKGCTNEQAIEYASQIPNDCPLSAQPDHVADISKKAEGDCISRQVAIEALRDAENHAFNSFYKGLAKAHKIIADLPSVQPNHVADVSKKVSVSCGQENDLISRQEALDAIMGQSPEPHYPTWYAAQIEKLPSAQPEIIRCKDCKWKNRYNCTRAVEVFIDDDKYCAWAERRTDE